MDNDTNLRVFIFGSARGFLFIALYAGRLNKQGIILTIPLLGSGFLFVIGCPVSSVGGASDFKGEILFI